MLELVCVSPKLTAEVSALEMQLLRLFLPLPLARIDATPETHVYVRSSIKMHSCTSLR